MDDVKNESYGKEGFTEKAKKLWKKTIFANMIKEKQERKKWERELRAQVRDEARAEAAVKLKKQYKQDEVDRLTGKKKEGKDWTKKLAEGFKTSGDGTKDNKFVDMMGMGKSSQTSEESSIASDEKIAKMMGLGSKKPEPETEKKTSKKKKSKKKEEDEEEKSPFDFDDKIKKMLG